MTRYKNPLQRLISATRYSLEGLFYALKNEQSFQYEAIVFVILCGTLLVIDLEISHKFFMAAMWLIVMALELVNSAVEKAFDLIDKSFRPEIKAGKDMLSGAVFIMISMNIILWLIEIFQRKLLLVKFLS